MRTFMVVLPRAQRVSQDYLNGEVQNETAFGQVGVVSHIRVKLSGVLANTPIRQENRKPHCLLHPVIQK